MALICFDSDPFDPLHLRLCSMLALVSAIVVVPYWGVCASDLVLKSWRIMAHNGVAIPRWNPFCLGALVDISPWPRPDIEILGGLYQHHQ